MRQAKILFRTEDAGILIQHDNGSYTFQYNEMWLADTHKPPISLTFPKKKRMFQSNYFFPFFFNMLPEGSNKELICKYNRIDLDDYFSLLMSIAKGDNIGAVSVENIEL